MTKTSIIKDLLEDVPEEDKASVGTEGQIRLTKTTKQLVNEVPVTQIDTEYFDTLLEAQTAKNEWDSA